MRRGSPFISGTRRFTQIHDSPTPDTKPPLLIFWGWGMHGDPARQNTTQRRQRQKMVIKVVDAPPLKGLLLLHPLLYLRRLGPCIVILLVFLEHEIMPLIILQIDGVL